jgi:predicted ATPase
MTDDGRAGAGEGVDSFVGREQEIGELLGFAHGKNMITLCGAGGVGKTRLMLRLLTDLAPGYPDGTFFVGLSDLRHPDLLASRVAAAIGVAEEPGVQLPDALADAVRERRLLLALDGCEHLAGACASLCRGMLAASPGLLVIAASREALHAAAEVTWPVPPLALPPAGTASPGQAASYDAVRLFTDRAAAASPGFALTSANCAAVTNLCRALGGLPLAIELAAARVRTPGAGQLAARLGGQAGPSPDRTLRAVTDWSHDLLSPAEQVLLRRLSVFTNWSVEIAERVCADDTLPAIAVRGLLCGLAERSLVKAGPAVRGEVRYTMPDTIREYAASRLEQAGETPALHRRLRDYALSVSEYYFAIGLAVVPAQSTARTQLFLGYASDAGNIRTALGWCLEQGDVEAGLRLCTAFGLCWIVFGARAEGSKWFGAFLAADQSGVPASVRGPALTAAAYDLIGAGQSISQEDNKQAMCWAAEGLEVSRIAGNRRFVSAALNLLAQADLRAGRPQDAFWHAAAAVDEARQSGNKWGEGYGLGTQAAAQAALGKLPEARESAEAGLAVLLTLDHDWGAARGMLGLAELCRALGDLTAARRHYLAALVLLRKVRGDPEVPRCLTGLGLVALDRGELVEARAYLTEGLTLTVRAGRRTRIPGTLLAFAALAASEGHPDRAAQLAAAATALRETSQPGSRGQQHLDAAAARLGEAEAGRLWAAGLKLTASTATELALEPPDCPATQEQAP